METHDTIRTTVQDVLDEREPADREVRAALAALLARPLPADTTPIGRDLMKLKAAAAGRTAGATITPPPVIDEAGRVHVQTATTRKVRP